MARKRTIDRQKIIDEGLKIIRKEGIVSLNARKLADSLGITTTPIFTNFGSMDNLLHEIWEKAKTEFDSYLLHALDYKPVFKEFGMRYLKFAAEQPNLFRFVFLADDSSLNVDNTASNDEIFRPIVDSIITAYHVDENFAKELMHAMMIFASGMAMMSVSYKHNPNQNEYCLMLTHCAAAVFEYMKKQGKNFSSAEYKSILKDFDAFPVPDSK